MMVSFPCPSFRPKRALAHGSNSAHHWDAFRPAVSWSVLVLTKSFANVFSGNPKLQANTAPQSCAQRDHAKEFQI